ncbi:MAG: murein hydrolase activator EnvC family protein [Eubacterium sp.]
MKKKSKIFSVGLSFALIAAMTCSSVLATVSEEKGKLSDLNKQKQQAESQKNELESSKAEAESYIKSVDTQLTNLSTEIYETNKKLDKTKNQIEKTEKKLKKAQESINDQYADMKLRIKYMYENGDTQMLDLILNSSSISDFLNKAEYITELSQYDRKMLNKMKETKQQIADAKESLEKNQKNLVALQEQQETDKSKLEKLSESKKKELDSYENLIAANEASADDLEAEISAQEKRVAAAEQASRAQAERESIAAAKKAAEQKANEEANKVINSGGTSTPPHVATVSGYTWPCPGYTTVSSDYGYRSDPFSGASTFHSGIDIPAPAGTAVVAAASGTVEWANYSSSAGNWIGINHGNGVYTVYMHMSALLVSAGTSVNAGQTIGLVGTTGSSTGNHLHFSVRKNGAYVNPWNYVGK